MQTLQIPRYASHELPAVDAVCRSILEHDQFDDWLPDPIYFADRVRNFDRQVVDLEDIMNSATRDFSSPLMVAVPHGERAFPASALSFELRATSYVVIGAIAKRLGGSLRRHADKVFGFRFFEGTPQFSAPGEELGEAILQAVEGSLGILRVHDISGFNATARAERLLITLQELGVRPEDELRFLRPVVGDATGALSSIDDATRFSTTCTCGP